MKGRMVLCIGKNDMLGENDGGERKKKEQITL